MSQTAVSQGNPVKKRQSIRVPSCRPVVMKICDSTIFATMTDFSKHGIGLMAMCDVHRGDLVEVHFDIPFKDYFKSFCFKAKVRHCIHISDRSHVGVRLDIDENEYTALFEKILES